MENFLSPSEEEQVMQTESDLIVKRELERLEFIDSRIPWEDLIQLISPHYHPEEQGNEPYELEFILRIFMLLSLSAVDSTLYATELVSMQTFDTFCGVTASNPKPSDEALFNFKKLFTEAKIVGKIANVFLKVILEMKR